MPEWSAEVLLPQLRALLDGEPAALRDVAAVVERECRRQESGATAGLGATFDAWGGDLELLRRA